MSIDRLFNWSSFTLTLLSVVGMGVALDAPWVLLVVGVFVVAARVVTDGPRGRVLSRRVSLSITLLAALVACWFIAIDPLRPLPAIGGFALTLTVLKSFERRTLENEAERIVLSFLLMALAAMISVEALFGVAFLLWAPLMCIVLLLFQVQHGRHRVGADRVPTEHRPPPAGPRARLHLSGIILLNLVLIAGGTMALFLVFPRGVTSELALAGASPIARTAAGKMQHLELVSGARVLSSAAEVATVTQHTGSPPVGGVLRLRTGVMSVYMGNGAWHPSNLTTSTDLQLRPGWVDVAPTQTGADSLATFTIELKQALPYLPVPAGLLAIKTDRSVRGAWDASRGVLSVPETGTPERYEVRADMIDRTSRGSVDAFAAWSDPDIRRLARSILERDGVAAFAPVDDGRRTAWVEAAASAFVSHLRSGTYRYTLDLSRLGQDGAITYSRDPVKRFLLEEPVGHCEYFAAGFTALCHSVGIQARIVTGFVSISQAESGIWTVRDRDAHAWCEVLVDEETWQPYDATPAAGPLFAGLDNDGSLAALWARARTAMELWWYGDVLGYDAAAQRMLANELVPRWRERLTDLIRGARDTLDRADQFFGVRRVGRVWLSVVALLGVGVIVVLVRRRRRLRAFARSLQLEGPRDARLARVRFWGEALRLLARAGLHKSAHESPRVFAAQVGRSHPELEAVMSQLVGVLYRRRFGHGDDTPSTTIDAHLNTIAGTLGLRRAMGS